LGTTALRNMLTKDVTNDTSMREALSRSDQMLKERMVAFMRNMGEAMQSEENTFWATEQYSVSRTMPL